MDTVAALARTGRVAFFVHERSRELPPAIASWQRHELSVLTYLSSGRVRTAPSPAVGHPWVVWRVLSANNREIGRGVGAFATLEAARLSAKQVVASADDVEAVLAFDRVSAHAWCLLLEGSPVVIAPSWHRSRRTNRLNLETVQSMLGMADLGGAVTSLDGHGRRGRRT